MVPPWGAMTTTTAPAVSRGLRTMANPTLSTPSAAYTPTTRPAIGAGSTGTSDRDADTVTSPAGPPCGCGFAEVGSDSLNQHGRHVGQVRQHPVLDLFVPALAELEGERARRCGPVRPGSCSPRTWWPGE